MEPIKYYLAFGHQVFTEAVYEAEERKSLTIKQKTKDPQPLYLFEYVLNATY